MPVVLPLLAFAFLFAGFQHRNSGWRESLLFASSRNAPAKIAQYSAELPKVQAFGNILLFGRPSQ